MFQPKTLSEMIGPLLVANFVLGMGIWPGRSRRMLFSVSYSILCLVCFCILTRTSMTYLETYYTNKVNDLDNLAFHAVLYVNILLTMCLIVTGWWRVKTMRIAFAHIAVCEKALEQIGISKNYRGFYLYQLCVLTVITLIFLVFALSNYDMMSDKTTPTYAKIILVLAGYYPVALLCVANVSFLHWVRFSRIRFKQLNDLLQRMLTTTPDSPQHKRVLRMKDEWSKTFVGSSAVQRDGGTRDNADTMRAVKHIHLELIKCTRTTNEAYGIQILLSMTVSFVFITVLLFDAYSILWIGMPKDTLRQNLIWLVCWIIFYASEVFLLNHMCALASMEAANTGDIICELYEPSTSKEFRAEIRDFTLQLIQNPLIFTACGFFTLDHTFIHGVIGSVTTYLVILIQVGDMPLQTPSNTTALYNTTDFTTTDISV